MSVTADPKLLKELKEFGMKDASQCFHCGNCTGVCPLSTEDHTFPRRFMRYAQLGLTDKIIKSPEPWLCYYCGECSSRCPRGADPGEAMMAMRRYLTSLYDWTGFSRKFYTSEAFEISAIVIVGGLVMLAMALFGNWAGAFEAAAKSGANPIQLNLVWPAHVIEIGDLIMAAILTFFLLSNVWRAVKFVHADWLGKIPFSFYIGRAVSLLINFLTQKKFSGCDDRWAWVVHLLIFTGYSSVFLMVVVGIRWFQRDMVIVPEYEALSYLMTAVGYYATAALLYGSSYAMIGRLKKEKPQYKNSHPTDWVFLILLFLTTLTGILVHAFVYLQWAMALYVIYIIHLGVAIPMLVLEVPFAKWSHLAYRPVILFVKDVEKAYQERLASVQGAHPVEEEAEEAPAAEAAS